MSVTLNTILMRNSHNFTCARDFTNYFQFMTNLGINLYSYFAFIFIYFSFWRNSFLTYYVQDYARSFNITNNYTNLLIKWWLTLVM